MQYCQWPFWCSAYGCDRSAVPRKSSAGDHIASRPITGFWPSFRNVETSLQNFRPIFFLASSAKKSILLNEIDLSWPITNLTSALLIIKHCSAQPPPPSLPSSEWVRCFFAKKYLRVVFWPHSKKLDLICNRCLRLLGHSAKCLILYKWAPNPLRNAPKHLEALKLS